MLPAGSNIVAIENTAPAVGDSGTTSTLELKPADPAQTIADVNAAVDKWATSNGVKVSNVKIRVDGESASASLRQQNAAGAVTGKPIDKVLALVKRSEGWVVIGERKP